MDNVILQNALPKVLLQVKTKRRLSWSLLINSQISYVSESGKIEIWFSDEVAKDLFVSSESLLVFSRELEDELRMGGLSFEIGISKETSEVLKPLNEVASETHRLELMIESLARKDEQIVEIKRSSRGAQIGLAVFFLIIIFGILFPNF